ncbi:MAG: hypothetical protein RMX68_008365 [Aulosira sp. ZfuVER01]|nr:hypothetical protein [Aulosira sp. ZfuVER01]MDZ7997590.1 hypothetical protein [Aulosira sp. DedVER01a]MDZ8054592.1 hypothetical protein [Aulosira sp. ZfuCHP01]
MNRYVTEIRVYAFGGCGRDWGNDGEVSYYGLGLPVLSDRIKNH